MIISSEEISNALKSFGDEGPFPYERSPRLGIECSPVSYGSLRPGLSPLQSRWRDCAQSLRLLLREILLLWAYKIGGESQVISSANVPSDLSLLAFGIPPAREAEPAGGVPKVPKGQGLGRLAR